MTNSLSCFVVCLRLRPGLVFALAFFPRAVYPVSRAWRWYMRSIRFGDAVLAGSWTGSYQQYHPGVTTMWLSGIGLKLYAWQRGHAVDQLPGHGPVDFKPWIAALAKIRYRGYVNPFMHGDIEADAMSEALAKSRDYLNRCYADAVVQ